MAEKWDESWDVIIVGSGAAGLTAAVVAARLGLKPLIIEKSEHWGGTSALSGGGLWVPGNSLQRAAGHDDAIEDAAAYLAETVPHEDAVTAMPRRMAMLREGPRLVDMLMAEGLRWTCSPQPDYYSSAPHARSGRSIDTQIVNGRGLGPWLGTMRRAGMPYALTIGDINLIGRGMTSVASTAAMAKVYLRDKFRRLAGQTPLGCGESLVAQLMMAAQRYGVEIRLGTALREMVLDGRTVTGIVTEKRGAIRRIAAKSGVLLAAGGFAHAYALRARHQGVMDDISSASREDTGDMLGIADAVGAQTAMLDEAWWGTAFRFPGVADPVFCLAERSLPHGLVVGDDGRRFVNESINYYSFGQTMRARGMKSAWLVIDGRHRRRYPFAGMLPGKTPQPMITTGFFKRAATLDQLAAMCGIDARGLLPEVVRFNGFAASGRDTDFGRGDDAYDRFWGDPNVHPNGSLGAVSEPPFFATKIYLSDLGTKGGLVTDEHARVLDGTGEPIARLCATGNCTASVYGRSYPGPGATLAPAMTFASLAITHLAAAHGP